MRTLRNLSLRSKFTIGMVVIFFVAIAASWLVLSRLVERRAEEDVARQGSILIEAMNAVRRYTTAHINPLLADELVTQPEFISETVPVYSAREVFENLRQNELYSDFFYKEASNNPTNPRNTADPFETQILQTFYTDPDTQEISGFRNLDGERVFYSARPLRLSSETCLQCHSDPAVAPASLINTYGPEAGFGWQMNDIIAAQMIYVPAEEVLSNAQSTLNLVMAGVTIVFLAVVLVVNFLLHRAVVSPIMTIAGLANKISSDSLNEGDLDSPEFQRVSRRSDELGNMATVFRQMAHSVVQRETQLKQEVVRLQVEIDQVKRAQQVNEITSSEYFKSLKEQAAELRAQRKNPGNLTLGTSEA